MKFDPLTEVLRPLIVDTDRPQKTFTAAQVSEALSRGSADVVNQFVAECDRVGQPATANQVAGTLLLTADVCAAVAKRLGMQGPDDIYTETQEPK